ncbi:MAG: UDP-glucose 4-epimerase GalE [Candidatus Gracilibacteria bacterium]|nr:UDP-glucose 4-epimerase GalE [Candidatus Gracilibacteria bacterium]
MKKKILITGGLGYIGSHAVVSFEQAGYETIILDNLSNSSDTTLDNISEILGYTPKFYKGDLRNIGEIETVFSEHIFDGVIHFAGAKAVGESCDDPIYYFQNNIAGSINLFEIMKKYEVKNIIFSSSATVYKTSPLAPLLKGEGNSAICETDELGTTNPYGTTKLLLEKILEDLSEFAGFRVINLRYFNPIGAHVSGKLGEDPEGIPNNLLPYIMKVANGELKSLQVFGNDYDTIDGTGVRDYIDVNDLVDGHLLAYGKLEGKAGVSAGNKTSPQPFPLEEREQEQVKGFCAVYNLGIGKGVSVLEMVEAARKITGQGISYDIVPRRSGDVGEVYCNPEKSKSELGFEAKVSLEESLMNSWKFYKK